MLKARTLLRILLYVFSFILLIFIILHFAAAPLVKGLLENQVEKMGNGQYTLSLGDVDVSLLKGDLGLSGVHLTTTSKHEEGQTYIQFSADSLQLDEVSWFQYLLSGSLSLAEVSISNSSLHLILYPNDSDTSNGKEFSLEQLNLYPASENKVQELSIGQIRINNLSINLKRETEGQELELSAAQVKLNGNDILLGPETVFSARRSFYATNWELKGGTVEVKKKGSNSWKATTEALVLSTHQNLGELSFKNFDYNQFGKFEKDTTLSMTLADFRLSAFDLAQLQGKMIGQVKVVRLERLGIKHQKDSSGKNSSDKFSWKKLNIGKNLPRFMQELRVDELEIEDAFFTRNDSSLFFRDGSLSATKIHLKDTLAFARNRFLYADRLQAEMKNLGFKPTEEGQEFTAAGFKFFMDEGKGNLHLNQLRAIETKNAVGKMVIEGEMDELGIKGINAQRLIDGYLSISGINILKPELVLHFPSGNSDRKDPPSSKTKSFNFYPFISPQLDSLTIDTIAIADGNLRLAGLGNSPYGLHIPQFNIKAENMNIAPQTAFQNGRVIHSTGIRANLQDLVYLFSDNVYILRLDQLRLDTRRKGIAIDGLRYGYNNNYRKKLESEETNEVYKLESRSIKAENINWENLMQKGEFYSERISAGGLFLYVYKDFNVPEKQKVKPMPAEMVLGIKFPMAINEFVLSNMEIVYEEMKKGAETAGLVNLTDMEGRIRNFTNIDRQLQLEPAMEVWAKGKLMGKGDFRSSITVPLRNPSQKVKVRGTMDTLNATELNRMVRYNTMVVVNSGTFYKLNWDFEAGKEISTGTMGVSYENLEIRLHNPISSDSTDLLENIGSELLNTFIVNSNIAEEKGTPPKQVQFEQKRNKERSFFHLYVQSLLAGLMEAIGIPFK